MEEPGWVSWMEPLEGETIADLPAYEELRNLPEERTEAGDAYFESMSRMQMAIANRRYVKAAGFAKENLDAIPKWMEEESWNAAIRPARWAATDRYLELDSEVELEADDGMWVGFADSWVPVVDSEAEPESTDDESLLPLSIPVF